jgi:hypothetical protein
MRALGGWSARSVYWPPLERSAQRTGGDRVNDIDQETDYTDALGIALTLPTWAVRRWERNATRRASQGAPRRADQARLLAVRSVLRDRERR